MIGVGRIVGIPASLTFTDGSMWTPLPGGYDLCCDACGATWVGHEGTQCDWCFAASRDPRLEQRRVLLFPPWLHSDAGDPRYDALGAIDQAIWRHTRGQCGDVDSRRGWGERLARAVMAGLITEAEALAALDRVERRG